MSIAIPWATRRDFLVACTAAAAIGLGGGAARANPEDTSIRPFRVNIPEDAIVELRRRVNATKWADRETVIDQSQGVQLATMQRLARYWGTDYDWRKAEARLNAWPQFITQIDGLDIH